LAFSPRLPTFINFRTKGFQSHHKEDCMLHAHAHVAVELSVFAINTNVDIECRRVSGKTFIRYAHNQKIEKPSNLEAFGSM
jgi:hypothetical protein